MLILGITDGNKYLTEDMRDSNNIFNHDSSVALIKDGQVIAAIEEERLNRIKHCNKHPELGIKAVFANTPYTLADVDHVCFFSLSHINDPVRKKAALRKRQEYIPHPTQLTDLLFRATGETISEEKIIFVPHQLSHAMVSYFQSGFEDSLIISMDGIGDYISGVIMHSDGKNVRYLDYIPESNSLGNFYNEVILHLGYDMFDEYKVMGMAPYGNPETFKLVFQSLYSLLPGGKFEFHREKFALLADLVGPRGEELTQPQKDFAMALQVALEDIIFHMVKHFQNLTKAKNLCLSGGVAFNCSSNGNILKSKLFDNIFVHPASNDAGGGLGAALCGYYFGTDYSDISVAGYQIHPDRKPKKINDVYWGTPVGDNDSILSVLQQWEHLIQFEKIDNITARAAQLIANDNVIGWVQGRSEFGPRALGNRSILADPRPARNKSRINAMVKLREGYRPFAPSVLSEFAEDYYDFPTAQKEFPYMTFILDTKPEKRELLGAVTHVDGTARVQTVSSHTNGLYWELINEFYKLSGVPILLNTSFNNNVEPIVDSAEDAIVCYLTTQLNYLVIGNYLIQKRDTFDGILKMRLEKLPYTVTEERNGSYNIYFNYSYAKKIKISKAMFQFLLNFDDQKSIGSQLDQFFSEPREVVCQQIFDLWSKRAIKLKA